MSAALTLLAFDYGKKRIGVAVGQQLTGTASALETVAAHDGRPDWQAISRLIGQWQPQALVVGMPLNMDGTEHEMSRAARRFGNQLHGRYNLPVHFVDERLSSLEAERQLRREGARGRPDKGGIDREAARLILLDWLEQNKNDA